MNVQLDTLAYTNRLRDLPPEQKGLFALGMLCLAFFAHLPVQMAIIIWMGIWIVGYAGIPAGIYLKMLLAISTFLVMSLPMMLINIVSVNSQLPVQADSAGGWIIGSWYMYLSHRGMEQALPVLTRSLASVSCMFFLLLTTPFAEVLQMLRRIGLPSIITELLQMMYRFIFSLLAAAEQLWIAMQARGGDRNWRSKMRSLSQLVTLLFQNTIMRYHQLSLGLAARGYNGEVKVLGRQTYGISKRYLFESILGSLGLLVLEWYTGGWMN
jgi:cobalt/nickel transport system permease protein